MASLYISGIDADLYRTLSERAVHGNRSISQEVVTILQAYFNRPVESPEEATRAFLALTGSWPDDRSAKAIATDIRKSRHNRGRDRRIGLVLE